MSAHNEELVITKLGWPVVNILVLAFDCVLVQSFHEVAYFADDRQDLLNGINEFLDYSIVIPPSNVEGKDLLKTVADFQKQLLRKRKERELKKQHSLSGIEQNSKGNIVCHVHNNPPLQTKSSVLRFTNQRLFYIQLIDP